jgi:dUTPase
MADNKEIDQGIEHTQAVNKMRQVLDEKAKAIMKKPIDLITEEDVKTMKGDRDKMRQLLDEIDQTYEPENILTEEEKEAIINDIDEFGDKLINMGNTDDFPSEHIPDSGLTKEEVDALMNTVREINEEYYKEEHSEGLTKDEAESIEAAAKKHMAYMDFSDPKEHPGCLTVEEYKILMESIEALKIKDDLIIGKMTIPIRVRKLHKSDVPYPDESDNPGYYHMYADFTDNPFNTDTHSVLPGRYRTIPTNIMYDIPEGYEIKVRLEKDHRLGDYGYEIKGALIGSEGLELVIRNISEKCVMIKQGQRIAEITIVPILKSHIEIIE